MKNIEVTKFLYEAWTAQKNSHAPYSKIKVGVALLTTEGKIYRGCNVETTTMSLSICAERVSLLSALADGKKNFVQICIVSETEKPLLPCGACRQLLFEFAPNLIIISANHKGEYIIKSLKELIPNPPLVY